MTDRKRTGILLVCEANICRSPYGEYLLATALPPDEFEVISAGTDALPGSLICGSAARALARYGAGAVKFAEAHRARMLSLDLLDGAEIVVTASRRERSKIAIMSPVSRSKTFTLLELAHLLRAANDRIEFNREESRNVDLAAVMHAQRGRAPLQAPTRFRRSAADPDQVLDIPDVHTGQTQSHRRVQSAIADSADALFHELQRARPTL